MSVFERITKEIRSGTVLSTPVQKVQFVVFVETDRVVFHVGEKTKITIPRVCWDGIPSFLRGKGWMLVGPRYDVAPRGSLQEYLDRFWSQGKSHSSDANYVASVLQHLGIAEVDTTRPSRIRLL